MTAAVNTTTTTTAPSSASHLPQSKKILPRNYGSEKAVQSHSNSSSYGNDSYYLLKMRGFFPVSRSVCLLLLVEPYEKLVQLGGSTMVGTLIYALYVPIGLVIALIALLGFVLWFDCCCQPWMIDHDKIGVYGMGRRFALPGDTTTCDNTSTTEGVEAVGGIPRRAPPITTCLCIYNSCLETQEVEYDPEEACAAAMAGVEQPEQPIDRD